MAELISMTYEQARAEHFKTLKDEAKHKMNYWATRVRRSRPNDLNDPAHIRAGEYAAEYSYYKDALEALEDNRFQYETGFVKGFESAQPKWISVEERLPSGSNGMDFCVLVLAYTQEQCITAGWNNGGTWYLINWDNDFISKHSAEFVTHWMPLPSGPKEEA